jgi:plastocyanin
VKRRFATHAAFLAIALVAAACGRDGGANGGVTATPPATGETETPTPGVTETPGETRIAMEDFRFDPSTFTVPTGATLELDNEGESPHTFTIQEGIDVEVSAGENGTVTIDLPAGDYDFVCRFHQGQGMSGTLTVSG